MRSTTLPLEALPLPCSIASSLMAPSMISEIQKLITLLPALSAELAIPYTSLGRIRAISEKIVSAVARYTTRVSEVRTQFQDPALGEDYLPRIDPDLLVCLGKLVDTILPAFVETLAVLMQRIHVLSTSHPSTPVVCYIMFRTMMSTVCMLSLDYRAWPPFQKIRPRVLDGVLEFSRWMAPPELTQAENTTSLLAKVVYWLRHGDECVLNVSPEMMAKMCGLARNLCRCVLNTHATLPNHCLSTGLMILLVSRRNLGPSPNHPCEDDDHIRRVLEGSFSEALGAARLSVQVLARSPEQVPPPGDVIVEFFVTLLGLEDSRVATLGTRGDAGYVKALLVCARRYPRVTQSCNAIVGMRLREAVPAAMTSEDISIWVHTLGACLRAGGERELVAVTLNSAIAAACYEDFVLSMHDFCGGLGRKGVMAGLERVLRGPSVRGVRDPGAGFLMVPYSAMQLVLEGDSAPPFEELLSLAVTAKKAVQHLLDNTEGDSSVSWGSVEASTLALSMVSTMGDLRQAVPDDRCRHQLFLAVALTMQPVLRNLVRVGADGAMLLPLLDRMPVVPDCDDQPSRWTDLVESFGRRHGIRLMRGCGNLVCKNMTGPLDSLLATALCAGCRHARYCGTGCQFEDWAQGGHRKACGKGWWEPVCLRL